MSKEAMKLALEALEGAEALLLSMGLTHLIVYGDAEKAITALREALAEQPAQQEPVAWWNKTKDTASTDPVNRNNADCQPLYTSPPAQRTWVGLTDEEIARVVSLAGFDPDWAEAHIAIQIVRTLEAKLKEKNT